MDVVAVVGNGIDSLRIQKNIIVKNDVGIANIHIFIEFTNVNRLLVLVLLIGFHIVTGL